MFPTTTLSISPLTTCADMLDSSFTRESSSAKLVKPHNRVQRKTSESSGSLLRRHSQRSMHCHGPNHSAHCLQRLEHVHPRQESNRSVATLERFLHEDTKEDAKRRGDREGYPRNGAGMNSFLDDWQRRWDSMSKAKNKKGLLTICHLY